MGRIKNSTGENVDGARTCAECGMRNADFEDEHEGRERGRAEKLEQAPVRPPKSKGRRWWADLRLHYAGYALGLILFYFLSLGPVMYFFGKMTTTTTGVVRTVSVQLSGWVAILYYPAFELFTADQADATYGAYVSWWIERRQKRD